MRYQRNPFAALTVLLITALACSLPGGQVTQEVFATVPNQPGITPVLGVTETFTPIATFTITLTPTITSTFTPSVPMVTVSQNTNCRTGPGTAYDLIGLLSVGESAEVVGRYQSGAYWVIKNPNSSGTCWLWGNYATVGGNTAGLPEMTAPPTPTPGIPNPPKNLEVSKVCVPVVPGVTYQLTAILNWEEKASNEDGFRVYRNGVLIATLAPNIVTYTDLFPAAPTGVVFTYSVESFNATGASVQKSVTAVCP